ncbi:hypothetical protein BC936DRAFT_145830, partial [Jimgerdemannia flammicorona]
MCVYCYEIVHVPSKQTMILTNL